MARPPEETQPYLAAFEQFENETAASTRPWLRRLRREALSRFVKRGFPDPHDEDWRFTPVAPLLQGPYELPPRTVSAEAAAGFRRLIQGDRPGRTLLAANCIPPFLLLESKPLPAGVIVCGLAEATERFGTLVEPHLGRLAGCSGQALTAWNTAFLNDGAFIYVPAGISVKEPIDVRFLVAAWNSDHPYVWHRRTLAICGENSEAAVVEYFSGLPGVNYFTNAVTEVVLGEGARIDHYKIQNEGNRGVHFHLIQVDQQRGSRFRSHSIAAGGQWCRNEVNVGLNGEECECTLNGLYQGDGEQFVDNHTRIDHFKPRCVSHELYKGLLGGRARGVFNGKIYVHPDAQKTDARQTSKTLLLSDDAVIDAKPQLEIFADDVKCTHGATIGQLDEEQIFYLRTRGIGRELARQLLIYGFAQDIVGRISIDELRTEVEETLLNGSGKAK